MTWACHCPTPLPSRVLYPAPDAQLAIPTPCQPTSPHFANPPPCFVCSLPNVTLLFASVLLPCVVALSFVVHILTGLRSAQWVSGSTTSDEARSLIKITFLVRISWNGQGYSSAPWHYMYQRQSVKAWLCRKWSIMVLDSASVISCRWARSPFSDETVLSPSSGP